MFKVVRTKGGGTGASRLVVSERGPDGLKTTIELNPEGSGEEEGAL